jgi:hypothetical protein
VKIANLMIFRRATGGIIVLKTRWKHHKSRDHNFLHRSYTPQKISALKKIIFFCRLKKIFFRKIFFFGVHFFYDSKNFMSQKCSLSTFSTFLTQKKNCDSENIFFEKLFLSQKKYIFFRSWIFFGGIASM